MTTETTSKMDLHYEVQGSGPPLVLIHGLALASQSWTSQISVFSKYFRVITYDLRGHGKSAKPKDGPAYSEEKFVTDLLELYQHLGLETAYLCGISLGGQIALRFAISYAGKVKALVIVSTGAGTGHQSEFVERYNKAADHLEKHGIKELIKGFLGSPELASYANQGPDARKVLEQLLSQNDAYCLAQTIRHIIVPRPPISELGNKLSRLAMPVLIVIGGTDTATHYAARVIAESVPICHVEKVDASGHLVNIEKPIVFNQLVTTFLFRHRFKVWADVPVDDARDDLLDYSWTKSPRKIDPL